MFSDHLNLRADRRAREQTDERRWRESAVKSAGYRTENLTEDDLAPEEKRAVRALRDVEKDLVRAQDVLDAHDRLSHDPDFYRAWTTSNAFPVVGMVPPAPLPPTACEWSDGGDRLRLAEEGRSALGRELLLLRADTHRAYGWLVEDREDALVSHTPIGAEEARLIMTLMGSETIPEAARRPLRALDAGLIGGLREVDYDAALERFHRETQ